MVPLPENDGGGVMNILDTIINAQTRLKST